MVFEVKIFVINSVLFKFQHYAAFFSFVKFQFWHFFAPTASTNTYNNLCLYQPADVTVEL